ncbi:hypothetical protein [Sorangium sp. So ce1389]|uniref:hypothetical protein n=1 Tax=Sorangium sp. So ce1389 TaxID=3133336 RepID=UPI003F62D13F
MTGDEAWRSLHDATLETIELRWESGEVRLRIRTGDPEQPQLVVVASSVHRMECARQLPWGFSVSINEVRGPSPIDGGGACVEVEMQSGDVIRIEALEFCVRGAD